MSASERIQQDVKTAMKERDKPRLGALRMLGAALNHSALNAANALGAWLGGLVIAAGLGYAAPGPVGAGLAVLGLLALTASAVLRRRELRAPAQDVARAPRLAGADATAR